MLSIHNNVMLEATKYIGHPSLPVKMKFLISSVILVFFLSPVYLLSSGGFQIVDMPILFLTIYVIATLYKKEIQSVSLISLPLSAFVLWAISINIFHYTSSFELIYLKASLQIIYITLIFFAFIVIFLRISTFNEKTIAYIFYGVLLSLLVPLMIKGNPGSGFETRNALSFNNSNQLAGHTIIIIAIALILYNQLKWTERRAKILASIGLLLLFILAHYYIFIAASRSGLASMIMIDAIALYKYRNKILLSLTIPMVALFMLCYGLFSVDDLSTTRMYKRLVKDDIYSAIEKRTAGRFSFEALTILFGAGKTNSSLGMKEIHNTFLDIFYSYGLIGGCLFIIFLIMYLKLCVNVTYHISIIISILPMAMTHNLIRSRILWIFLALALSIILMRTHVPYRGSNYSH